MAPARTFGLDLGTTHASCTWFSNPLPHPVAPPEILELEDGSARVPAVVRRVNDSQWEIGSSAWEGWARYPRETQADLRARLTTDPEAPERLHIYFSRIRQRLELALGQPLHSRNDRVVLGIPQGMTPEELKLLLAQAESALLPQPTACSELLAALRALVRFGQWLPEKERALCIDCGGLATQISLVRAGEKENAKQVWRAAGQNFTILAQRRIEVGTE